MKNLRKNNMNLKKNIIIVTGGAGFVGSNMIESLVKKTKFRVISLDDYSSGSKKNHIKSKNVIYINGHTKNIYKILGKYKKKINTIFHFGEFSRIYQSFLQMNNCIQSNTIGTNATSTIKAVVNTATATTGGFDAVGSYKTGQKVNAATDAAGVVIDANSAKSNAQKAIKDDERQ